MKKYSLIGAVFFALSISFAQAEIFKFTDEKTQDTLSVCQGSENDWETVKACYLNFHKPQYDAIPADKREFSTIEELVDEKFSDHYKCLFIDQKYSFFLIKNVDKFVGYIILDRIGDSVYSIESQGDLNLYSIQSIVKGFTQFIKQKFAPDAQYFMNTARKAVPLYAQILTACGFEKVETLHPSLANVAELYQGFRLSLH